MGKETEKETGEQALRSPDMGECRKVDNLISENKWLRKRVKELEGKLKHQVDNGDEERRLLKQEYDDRKGD